MKKALLISYSFPPSSHSNAKRPGMVAHRLLAEGWSVDVITSNYEMSSVQKETIRHDCLTITRLEDKLYNRLGSLASNRVIEKLFSRLCSLVFWPDKRVLWVRRVCRALQEKDDYDLVVVSVVPISSLCLARWYNRFDSRWIVDYQEPVIPELMQFPSHLPLHKIWFNKLRQLEELALEKCGCAVFSSESCRDAYVQYKLVESGKTAVVSHSYNPDAFDNNPSADNDRFDIVYTGSFHGRRHGDRSPEPFLRAFKKFLDAFPEAHGVTRFIVYGQWLSEHDHLVSELNLGEFVDIRPPVYGADYFKALQASPVLLLVTSECHNLHVPGKLADYLGAGRPILAFVPKESETHRILRECRLDDFCCTTEDDQREGLAIVNLWERYKKNELIVCSDRISRWSAERQMDRMMAVVNDVSI